MRQLSLLVLVLSYVAVVAFAAVPGILSWGPMGDSCAVGRVSDYVSAPDYQNLVAVYQMNGGLAPVSWVPEHCDDALCSDPAVTQLVGAVGQFF